MEEIVEGARFDQKVSYPRLAIPQTLCDLSDHGEYEHC